MFLLVLAAACLFAAVYVVALAPRRAIRVAAGRAATYGRPLAQRQKREPFAPKAVATLARIGSRVPRTSRADIATQLMAAGLGRIDPDTYIAGKTFVSGTLSILVLLVASAGGNAGAGILLALLMGVLTFVLPDFALRRRASERRETMLRCLPSALDLLAVSVEAGLGIDGAIARYAETARGPLAEELGRVVAELRVGAPRREVLHRFAERVPSQEATSFVRAVVHSEQMGVSLTTTLRSQASEARSRRQALAEERAGKMPVKMLIPTVFLVFPALFVVLLGPAVLHIVSVFSGK